MAPNRRLLDLWQFSKMIHSMSVEQTREAASVGKPEALKLGRADGLGMLSGVFLCLLFCCWFSYGRIFWEDEMLGWMLLHDPSWHHLVTAWKMGADGGGFAFYLLGRGWFMLFGASDVSFRLFSASCFALGFCFTWLAARRYYKVTPVAIALFTTWFLCPPMVMHMVEGRFYGLLVCATSLAAWVSIEACERSRKPLWLYVAAFAVNGLLTTTHTLGIMYSGFLLAAVVIVDRTRRRFHPLFYACVAASWLLLWPEREAIIASANVGKPWFWTYPPDLIRFAGAFCGFSNAIAFVLFLLIAILIYTSRKQPGSLARQLRVSYNERRPVYFLAGSLFCIPLLLGIQAHVGGTSLFINRYLLPVNIGLAFVLAEIVLLIRWDLVRNIPWFTRLDLKPREAVAAFGLALLLWNVIHVQPLSLGAIDYSDGLTAVLPRGIPIVLPDAWAFTELIGRQHDSGVQYTYMLDWENSIARSTPRLEVTQYHLMENWKKAGYFSGSIHYRDEFLQSHRRFVVLKRVADATDRNGIVIGNQLVRRFLVTPGVQVTRLRKDIDGYSVWLVCTDPVDAGVNR